MFRILLKNALLICNFFKFETKILLKSEIKNNNMYKLRMLNNFNEILKERLNKSAQIYDTKNYIYLR